MNQTKRIYAAYGSNLNLKQMEHRCPGAKVTGSGWLLDYRLTFRAGGVANVEHAKGRKVPILLWEITPECELALDIYEGFPRLYTKQDVYIKQDDGERIKAMVYVMTEQYRKDPAEPGHYYLNTIWDGYTANKLPLRFLREAVAENQRECDEARGSQRPWELWKRRWGE